MFLVLKPIVKNDGSPKLDKFIRNMELWIRKLMAAQSTRQSIPLRYVPSGKVTNLGWQDA
jgi:hypothetical protein